MNSKDIKNGYEGDEPKPDKRHGKDLCCTVIAGMKKKGQTPERFRL